MRPRVVSIATGALLTLLGAAQAQEASLHVVLENLDGPRAKMRLEGFAQHLPDGALLHISLTVRDQVPPIEAGFFRAAVQGGKYSGVHEWDKKTFAPLMYRTQVSLLMEVQNPNVKRFLARELGYTGEHVEIVGVTDTAIGTTEEQAAFQLQTLRTLKEFHQRVNVLHAALGQQVLVPATDPAFVAFGTDFVEKLRTVLEELELLRDTRVVWFDDGIFAALNQALRQVSRTFQKHKSAHRSVPGELANTARDLGRIQSDIDSRLPVENNSAPGGPR